jgi:hypothetical protein
MIASLATSQNELPKTLAQIRFYCWPELCMWVARNTQIAGHHHRHDHHDLDHGVVQEMPKLGVKLLVILITIIIIIWGCKKTLCPKWLAGKFVLFFSRALSFSGVWKGGPLSLSLSVCLSLIIPNKLPTPLLQNYVPECTTAQAVVVVVVVVCVGGLLLPPSSPELWRQQD